MDPRRSERVATAIAEELSEIVNYELADPRLGELLVTDVILSTDGRRAIIRVSLAGDASSQRQTLEALRNARRHVRVLLAGRLDLFRVPDLEFEPDLDIELRARARPLLRRIRKGRPKDEVR